MVDEPDAMGALVIRVWRSPSEGADSPLVARLMGRGETGQEETAYATGVADILSRTREWLLRYDAG